jgi:GNAT superfamily N-acetyltransferase
MLEKMADLPEHLFADPVWNALQTQHRHLALSSGNACRYPSDVAPFAALAAPTPSAMHQLHSLLTPGESIWIAGKTLPRIPIIHLETSLECLQMVLPEEIEPPAPTAEIIPLSCDHASEMVALTDLAFPGFFRPRTCVMGSYYGIRSGNDLIAMGGERLNLTGYPEISGLCTHPEHRGKSYAASLIWHLAHQHRRNGLTSWLHVAAANQHAINLYLRLGFITARKIMYHRIQRIAG